MRNCKLKVSEIQEASCFRIAIACKLNEKSVFVTFNIVNGWIFLFVFVIHSIFGFHKYANRLLVASMNIGTKPARCFLLLLAKWERFGRVNFFCSMFPAVQAQNKKKLRKKLKFHYKYQTIDCVYAKFSTDKKKDFNSITTVNGLEKVFFIG